MDKVTLAACPPGLFRFNGTLCFKSEYTTTLENPRRYQCDAYVVESGEYFHGGAPNTLARSNLLVEPLATPAPDSEMLREAAFRERWYYALNEDAEHWYGAKDTRDEAIEAGRIDHNGEAFYICAGTPMRHQLDPFTDDVDGVINAFQNANEEMFGEDGQGDPENDWTDDQCRELARRLNATFAEWARDHGHDKAYMLDLFKGEIVPALGASA